MPTVLVLRTCQSDMSSYGGFVWPTSGHVTCPDWDPKPECGNGLHGLLWGEGDGPLLSWDTDAKWLVLEVGQDELVDLGGKIKFPSCNVVFCGGQKEATEYLVERLPTDRQYTVVGAEIIVGDGDTATTGDGGTATTGDRGMAIVGDYGTAITGYGGIATAGDFGTAITGDHGTATAGNYSTAIAGDYGTATTGYYGKATAGHKGTAIAGYGGTATAGCNGISKAGDKGTIIIKWWSCHNACRVKIGRIGEDGLRAGVFYKLNAQHEFAEY